MKSTEDGPDTASARPRAPRGDRAARSRPTLVTLGSAAVLAIYSAGYVRTREAAEQIAAESNRRSPPHVRDTTGVAAPIPLAAVHGVASVGGNADTVRTTTVIDDVSTPVRKEHAVAIDSSVARKHTADSSKSLVAAPLKSVDPVQAPVDTTPPANAPTSPATGAPPSPPSQPSQAADTAVTPVLHDGTYSGWGTSRHGDIQATVEVKGGLITAAYISQCLTRYSCSWIAALPPQVVTRQSPEVDYVSGATQSTNAFYYAVVDALTKAK
jgi:uncharacterized protein with FMN-binding domain